MARSLKFLTLLCLGVVASSAFAADPPIKPLNKLLTADEVTMRMVRMNTQRSRSLQAYESTRVYSLQYHGFPGSRSAEMVVLVKYTAPATKDFTIQSSSGSKLVIDRVFKKLMESEKEALDSDNQARTALTPANYLFTMLDYVEGSRTERPMYVLAVEPKTPSKFLYRGKIWVDAEDFAVARIQAEPAKNPSFWTKNTTIDHHYFKVNDYWFPVSNHSVSEVRLGGHADLKIEYKDYQVTSSRPVPDAAPAHSAR